ncbi:ecdysone receptor isoform X3 [Diorhabda carinulata]|uniref:ecdysone receptor isoform X3 n=1 Tax=Diorhabda carinulata TaxID=1163345 RepID=UPI0025A162AC|nr:ecdysone receptor isoform X3 [Diorhabda carinulata]XP_057654934.1 ecdysone receptor isoform X3 [Diorhabda carinulata]XP_057654935.1 ecdysone receptor isoform X3 [Diorhabda carinulata]
MTTVFRAGYPSSYLCNMDIKHEMIYRDDDVLHVKSEPQLYSPNAVNGASIAVGGNLLTGGNNGLMVGTSNNGLIVTSNGAGAFTAFGNSAVGMTQGAQSMNKRSDFLGSPSPGTMSGNNAPPLTPSPGPPAQPYTVISNGYPSPMSSGSYDPYSPNGKIGREDLSPPSSLNGYSADSCDSKKKKGPTPRQQEELCLVCGDRASGYHYNALTCEGCKGFFRRSITKNAVYQCKYGNHCEIDMYMRRKCQECRLKKCLSVGMRPECVVPEVQCAVKRKEKKAQKEKDKPNSTTNGSPDLIKMEPESYLGLFQLSDTEKGTTNGLVKAISPEQEELIHRLVYFQNEYEHPSEEDVKRIVNAPMEGEDQCDVRFRHITEITILTVQLIVEFAKRLPGFDKLLREDQISLLKACSSEVMMFRMARRYDYNTDSILFVNNQPYSRDSYNLAGMGETIEDLLHFCRTMYSMQVDNAEYALLTAIVIFSERPDLIEGWKVEKIQEIYLEALRAYVDNRRKPRPGTVFAKLLSVLTELRTLGNQNSKMCFSLKLKNKKLPPFLAEIWDVDLKT